MSVRLACLSHAASVRSEPGSNSSVKVRFQTSDPARGRTARYDIGLSISTSVRMKAADPADRHVYGPIRPWLETNIAIFKHHAASRTHRAGLSHPHNDKPVHLSKSSLSPRSATSNVVYNSEQPCQPEISRPNPTKMRSPGNGQNEVQAANNSFPGLRAWTPSQLAVSFRSGSSHARARDRAPRIVAFRAV